MIRAECHTDDRVVEAEFDATKWFEQASKQDIQELAACEWGGDYPADNVATFMADHESNVADMFKYLELVAHKKDHPGFECHINVEDAVAWAEAHEIALPEEG
jgi:hypothetical protein